MDHDHFLVTESLLYLLLIAQNETTQYLKNNLDLHVYSTLFFVCVCFVHSPQKDQADFDYKNQ